MRSHNVDEDTLRSVQSALDMIKIYKVLHENKALHKSDYEEVIMASDEYPLYERYEFLDNSFGILFGEFADPEMYIVNEPESEICADFPGVADYYPYDEYPVNGISIKHEAIDMYLELCKEHDIDIEDTILAQRIYKMDMGINTGYYDGYYSEIFMPEKELLDKYHMCIFYTEADWLSARVLEQYYDAVNYVLDVVTHPKFNKEMLISEEALEVANGKRNNN